MLGDLWKKRCVSAAKFACKKGLDTYDDLLCESLTLYKVH